MCKSFHYAELYQKVHQATGADLPSFDLFLGFNSLTNDKLFHSSQIQNPTGNMEGKMKSFEYGGIEVSRRFKCRRNAVSGHKGFGFRIIIVIKM